MKIKHLAAIAALIAVASCGGGAGNGTVPGPSGSGSGPRPMSTVTFTITIPKAAAPQFELRRPMYVSPNTQSIVIQQLDTSSSHNPVGNPVTMNVTSTTNGCTTNANGTTCSVTFPAPAGTFDFSVKTYSNTNGGGSLLSENVLTTFTVIAGQGNTINVTLNGVIAAVSATASISGTLSQAQTLNFTPQDASGATIIGPGAYDNGPLTITDQNSLVSVTPSAFHGPADGTSTSVQCNTPGSGTLQFADASGNLSSVRYTCAGAAISIAPGSLDFDTVAASSSDATYDQTVTATDPNPNPAITWTLSCTPSGAATANPATHTSVAIRPIAVGTCTLFGTDQYNQQSNTINVEVHTTSIVIQSHKVH